MTSYTDFNIKALLEIRDQVNALIAAAGGDAGGVDVAVAAGGAAAATAKKTKKIATEKRKGAPAGPWAAWTKLMLAEHAEEVAEFKRSAEKQGGAHLAWMSQYRKSHEADYAAFAQAFVPEVSDTSSVDDGEKKPRKPRKPRAPMTAEAKAAMAAKKAATLAAKKGAAAGAEDVAKAADAPVPLAVAAAPPAAAVPAPPPAAAEAEEATEEEAEEEAEEEGVELLPFSKAGRKYLRLGTLRADGSKVFASGDLWECLKGAKGDYVGCLQDDGSIDTSSEEPELE